MSFKTTVRVHKDAVIMKEQLRNTGRTTKIVDKAIQTLFIKGVVIAKDHVNERYYNIKIYERILGRLISEHRVQFETDRDTLTIRLKQNKIRTNGKE